MAYLIKITPRAERDLAHLYEDINVEHSDAALQWYSGLKQANLFTSTMARGKRSKRMLWGIRGQEARNAYFAGSRLMNCREAEFMQ
jgi:plasmid stabilization system protein ParE